MNHRSTSEIEALTGLNIFPKNSVSINSNNSINSIKSNNSDNRNNSGNASRETSPEVTIPYTSSRPVGQTSSEDCSLGQKALGVSDIAPRNLFAEIENLKRDNMWIETQDISFVKVDLYLTNPNDLNSILVLYTFVDKTRKTKCQDNGFKSQMTLDYYTYIEHPRRIWSTNKIAMNYYESTYLKQKEVVKSGGAYWAGKTSRKKKWGGSPASNPLETHAGVVLYEQDDDLHIEIQHHGAFIKLSKPGSIFYNDLQTWIKEYGPKQEQKTKGMKNVPPLTSFVYRELK